jgi:hypothetical protein
MPFPGVVTKPLDKVDDYKTYIVAIAAGILGILEVASIWTMPAGGWFVLSALGLGSIRHTLKKLQGK